MSCYSMMEKQPQIRLSMQACRKLATSGPSSRDINSGLVSIDSPCSEYSGNTTRSMVGVPLRAFCTIAQIFLVCAARSLLAAIVNEPDDDAVGSLVQSAESTHGSSLLCVSGSRARPIYTLRRPAGYFSKAEGLRLDKSASAPS